MKSLLSYFYILLTFNAYNKVSLELLSEDVCSSEDTQALSHWYSEIYKFVNNNQNVTQHLINLNAKIMRLEENQRELREQLAKIEHFHNNSADHVPNNANNEIVIQRRHDGSVDFNRNWNEYKQGFGNSSGEFFIGLEKLHKITNSRPYALVIVMEDQFDRRHYAHYDLFAISSGIDRYKLKILGKYSGTAGDSLSSHVKQFFYLNHEHDDFDNLLGPGGWWNFDGLKTSEMSNLNALYINPDASRGDRIRWSTLGIEIMFVEMILIKKN